MIHPIVFGKFILLERVSVGGMAEVYRAKLLNAPNFDRFFAIKRILPHLAADKDFVTMFINEAKVAVELEHPNVCQIYELGRLGQSHYIAMEFITGRDILAIQSHYRRQKKIMSISQACFIIAQAAQGLDYAHRAVDSDGKPLGLVHRDVSPQNLIVTYDGVVKLIDFGVSKASRKANESHSKSGVVKGKFSYMSPEQAADEEIDHRSDIFALGVVFWEMLTGHRLFQSESEYAIMEKIQECKIDKPSKYNKMVPEAVDRICMKALEKDPAARYQWASEMMFELFEFINSCKTPFTQWHLERWMCTAFEKELAREWSIRSIAQSINTIEDIERYNREHKEDLQESSSISEEEIKTSDISALDAEQLSEFSGKQETSEAVKLKSGNSSKSMPGVQSLSIPNIQDSDKKGEPCGARLSIQASDMASDEDAIFEPEGVAPTELDPGLREFKRAERKARVRKGLMVLIALICACFIICPVVLLSGIVTLPKPVVNLPDRADVTFNIFPESKDALVSLYHFPKKDHPAPVMTAKPDPSGAGAEVVFHNLKAGVYAIDVSMPGYEDESFSLTLENGNSEARLEMTRARPWPVSYEVEVFPDDASLFVNGEKQAGHSPFRVEAIAGENYSLRAFKIGFEPVVLTGTVEKAMGALQMRLHESEPLQVWVRSDPARAVVYEVLGNRRIRRGETPVMFLPQDTSRPMVIEVMKPGHLAWQHTVDFSALSSGEVKLFADLVSE